MPKTSKARVFLVAFTPLKTKMTNGKSPCPIGTFHFQEQIHLHPWWIFPLSWYCHVSFLRFRCRDFQEFALLELPKHSLWDWNILEHPLQKWIIEAHWGSYCWLSNSRLKLLGMHTTYTASQTITEIHWDLGGFDTVDRFSHEFNWKQWISHEVSGDFSSCSSIGWNVFFSWCLEPLGTKSGWVSALTSDGWHLSLLLPLPPSTESGIMNE